jgi:hypothetical protein
MSAAETFWEPPNSEDEDDPEAPPVPEGEIREWEGRNGLRLPASLAEAMRVQNGGRVRGTDLMIESLGGFSVLDDEQWDEHFSPGNQEEEEFEGVDRSKLLSIGDCWGCGVVLDYRRGPDPKVLTMHHNLGGILRDEACGFFDEFIEGLRR